jgi:hypothetical protein
MTTKSPGRDTSIKSMYDYEGKCKFDISIGFWNGMDLFLHCIPSNDMSVICALHIFGKYID